MAVPDSTDAAALLLSYVESYRAVRAGPCWLFPRFSRHVLEKRASAPDDAAAVVASGDLWLGGFRSSAVPELPWVEPLFGHVSFEQIVGRADDVVRAARPVWGPVLSAKEAAEAVVAPSGTASRKRVGP